uniref:forkhead box protein N1 isoform X2 n=1 Tax=Scatophagus argus TaxID=75038 RepID=UPI001ED85CF1|nr:forkhead box protein N1 isoform X2 [Scatophagus argus]
MSDSPPFYPSSSKSQASTPQASLHTCVPCGTSCQQMAESQTKEVGGVCFTRQENNTFSLKTTAVSRRHSADETITSQSGSAQGRGSVDSDRFHPYHRQFSEGAVTAADCLQQCLSSFSCLEEACSPDTCSHGSSESAPPSWEQYNCSFQSSYPELPGIPLDPSSFRSQSYSSCSSSSPLHQVSSRQYTNNDQSNSSKYSTQLHQESTTQHLFPKPIYSYSILIFMALKNSKTGSLPVSEIYSFMTEHFPYFKTAPDGWKNSVRHNLSLNKCFVKVENKNGNSSRKGCLWALNPAKVEKMQDELHKWRRKDPITVRRSMAKPECLDRLLGDKPDKHRCLPPYTNPALLSRVAPIYSTTSASCTPAQLQLPCLSIRRPQYSHIQPQQPCYLPPAAAQPSNSFAMYSPGGQPPATGSLNSPMAGKMPPVYSTALQTEYSLGPRSMQEFPLEGETSCDIDTLNPSLTDLQLQEPPYPDQLPARHTSSRPSTKNTIRERKHRQWTTLRAAWLPEWTAPCGLFRGGESGWVSDLLYHIHLLNVKT